MKRKLFIIFNLFFAIQSIIGQELSYEQFTDSDGLPSMTTYNIVQDRSGLIWVGTENGLVSFDGDEFVRYSHPDLNDNDMVNVSIDVNGRVYFTNLSKQFGYLENQRITIVNDQRIKGKVYNMGSSCKKIYVFVEEDNENPLCYEVKKSMNESLEFEPRNVYLFEDTPGNYYAVLQDCSSPHHLEDKQQLINSEQFGKFQLNNQTFFIDQIHSPFKLFLADSYVEQFINQNGYERIENYGDDFYILKNKGATYYNTNTNHFSSFLEDLTINSVFIDLEGNAWISTPNKGLYRIADLDLKFSQSRIKISDGVQDIMEDGNGNIYVGTLAGGLIFNPFRENEFILISDLLRPVHLMQNKKEILAYDQYTIFRIDKNSSTREKMVNPNFGHKKILETDSLVFTSRATVVCQTTFKNYINSHSEEELTIILNQRALDMHYQKKSGHVYFGTINGLYVLRGNDKIPHHNEILGSQSISSIIDGDDNSLWIGTSGSGIYNLKNDSIFLHLNKSNGLLTNNINTIEKFNDELLISTPEGLHVFDLNKKNIKVISDYNFLPSSEVLVCKVINNEYWVGTQDGLTIISKEDIENSTVQKPFLSLKKLYANGEETTFNSGMHFEYSVNNIQINLQNISHKSGKDKYIKYRIRNIDTVWITTTESILRLPSLNPGKYHIEALGVNAIGVESNPLNLYFTINQPWWETWWARLLGFLVLLSVGLLIFRVRMGQEKQKRDYLTQINDIRDQALQLQMNPHFIFNSLNAIQGFIGTDDEEMAMNYLARFARLIRLIFEHSKGNTITLEEELEFINLYLDLEKLRFKDKVEVDINIDKKLEQQKDLIKVPPLLIQPIVENSFKHGLFHKKGKGKLNIDYSLIGGLLQIVVQDNGIGRVEAQRISQKNTEKQSSSGIKTTMERIDLLNFGKGHQKNSIKIEDLYHKDGSCAGTKTILNLVLNDY